MWKLLHGQLTVASWFPCDPTQILEFTVEMVSALLDIGLAKSLDFHVTENPSRNFLAKPMALYTVIIYVSYY